jgi:hypothetical protein
VRKALRGFVLGSAGGMSRLTPRHLPDITAYSGSTSLETVGRVVARFADGRLPAEARRFFFGARLVALAKVGGGLRPIACGDVFRRMAAKLLCARAGEDAAAFLATSSGSSASRAKREWTASRTLPAATPLSSFVPAVGDAFSRLMCEMPSTRVVEATSCTWCVSNS